MTSLAPPSKKIWWKEPIERGELIWIAVVVVWGIILTLMMPFWHVYGNQNLSSEAYRTTPKHFWKKPRRWSNNGRYEPKVRSINRSSSRQQALTSI